MKPSRDELACLMGREIAVSPSSCRAAMISINVHSCAAHLLPASAIGVRDDVEQRVRQVAVTVERVVPPTDGYVGEVPARGDGREEV